MVAAIAALATSPDKIGFIVVKAHEFTTRANARTARL